MNKSETQYSRISNPHGYTILIVDDEPANLEVVANYLANSGFRLKVARTGEAGLELARQIPPDLILLDVLLPGIDGFEVCRCLKADERTRAVPVIFMTIMTKTEDKVKGFQAGGVDYITKPFQREEVLARVTTHLRIRGLTRRLEEAKESLERQVEERTAALTQANQELQAEIAERKRAEEEIQTLNQELEHRVIQRTAQLEASNHELEAFAYSVSHDLRAPLRHIDGFLELLRQRLTADLDAQSQHYLDTIADAATRMGLLIDDLLSFSRMGRSNIVKLPVDLASMVQEVIRELGPETRDRDIHWQIADLPEVTGDRGMLRVVLVNLLANAVKFTRPRDRAEIEIGCQPDQGEVVIFVRDNGVGFDMQYVDKLFGVFQRLHHADEFEGTGIGLANVRRIITRHGGRTWAEGQPGQGAAFYFSLPETNQQGASPTTSGDTLDDRRRVL